MLQFSYINLVDVEVKKNMTASRREAVGIKQEALHRFKALDATISSRTLKTRKVSRRSSVVPPYLLAGTISGNAPCCHARRTPKKNRRHSTQLQLRDILNGGMDVKRDPVAVDRYLPSWWCDVPAPSSACTHPSPRIAP